MNLEKIDKNDNSIIKYSKTDNVLTDICSINVHYDYYSLFEIVNMGIKKMLGI